MIEQDEEEEFKARRDAIEYMAMYVNPKGVDKVVKSRESKDHPSTNIGEITDGTSLSSGTDDQFAEMAARIIKQKTKPKFQKR